MADPVLILVDIEHSASAETLLDAASAQFPARMLHVAYVMPFGFYSYIEPYVLADVQRAAADRARSELSSLLERTGLGETAIQHVLRGGVGEQALRLAAKIGASVIVLNASRRDSPHTTLGTQAAQIARHARCSVMLMR